MSKRRNSSRLLRGQSSFRRTEAASEGPEELRQGGANAGLSDEHGQDGSLIVQAIGSFPGLSDSEREALTDRVAEWVLVARTVYADTRIESAVMARIVGPVTAREGLS